VIWLPYANLRKNLEVMTVDHVYDVVYEGLQCLRDVISGVSGRDVRAWRNRPGGLFFYVKLADEELQNRRLTGEPQVLKMFSRLNNNFPMSPLMPTWFGDPDFHLAQRSHLIRVDPVHYARRLPLTTPLEIPLIWPRERKLK
jgi:hypothetical protein